MLDQIGCTFKDDDGALRISKGSLVIMKGVRRNGLYTLQGKTLTDYVNSVSRKNYTRLRFAFKAWSCQLERPI